MHAHFVPTFLLEEAGQDPERYGLQAEPASDGYEIRHREGYAYPVPPTFYSGLAMRQAMAAINLDGRIVSVVPPLMLTGRPPEMLVPYISRVNESAAELGDQNRGAIWAMGAVPLPHIEESVAELDRIRALGLVGVQIPCVVGSRHLDHPDFRPFFRRAAELDLPIFLHPVYVGPKPGLEDYYFVNSIGNPYDTLVAISRLIHGGVLAELPQLRIVLAHGGGFFPYQRGRLAHAWKVRPEPKVRIARPPLSYLGNVYYDALTHDPISLRFLVEAAGAEKVMMGSDFPFDMGLEDVVGATAGAGLPEKVLRQVQGENAARLFGLAGGD